MNNQTIDGVPRKLLEGLLTLAAMSASAPYRELRALLDAPYPSEAQLIAAGFGYPMSKDDAVKAYKASLLPRTDNPSNADCEWCHGCGHDPYGEPCVGCCTPAAQPQGEPAAHTIKSVMTAIWSIDGFPMLTSNQCYALAQKLNEQPAPVAVVLPERLQQVLKFLEGAENLDGYWFGEPGPTGSLLWWRNELRKALAETNLFATQQ